MATFRLQQGRVIRRRRTVQSLNREVEVDDQVLKTKIVATLGRLEKYKDMPGADGRPLVNPTYDEVIKAFYAKGVDVIRLNLSHKLEIGLRPAFRLIKQAILNAERAAGHRKRIALLADLPGPKIRFKKRQEEVKDEEGKVTTPGRPMVFEVGERFVIHFDHFDEEDEAAAAAVVEVDDTPLRAGLASDTGHGLTISQEELLKEFPHNLVENALAVGYFPNLSGRGPFEEVLHNVSSRLDAREPVFVTVGDGEVVLEVEREQFSETGSTLPCRVVSARTAGRDGRAEITSAKGFTIKGVDFDVPSFTDHDEELLGELLAADFEGSKEAGWEQVLTFVTLSFAQTADDALRIRKFMEHALTTAYGMTEDEARLRSPSVIAKIETRKGWENRKYILDVADGIMVARGDLGLQVDIEEVPDFQKRLIKLCNKRGKPVITATQMLSSMTNNVEPTRAEATDVFNAILDGSDAVMMSEETADGKYPALAIEKMVAIARRAEWYFERRGMPPQVQRDVNLRRFQEFLEGEAERVEGDTQRFNKIEGVLWAWSVELTQQKRAGHPRPDEAQMVEWKRGLYIEKKGKANNQPTTDRITQATCTMSESGSVKGIIAATTSGRTVRMISRLRPSVLLTGAAHDIINTRKLAVSYGVLPICIGTVSKAEGTEGIFSRCRDEIDRDEYLRKYLPKKETVIFTAGTRLGHPGTTNLIQMREIEGNKPPQAPASPGP